MKIWVAGVRRPLTLGLQRYDLAVLPNINRRAVGSGCLARRSRCASEGTPDRLGKFRRLVLSHGSVHGPRSKSSGIVPELSYTAHSSASALYATLKFLQPRSKRRNTSGRDTSCFPAPFGREPKVRTARGDLNQNTASRPFGTIWHVGRAFCHCLRSRPAR